MHRLPKLFFTKSNSNSKSSKPKLNRQNAFKNIPQDYSSPSTSSSSTSFRVDGDIETLCKSLGFSIDDLSIPVDEYAKFKPFVAVVGKEIGLFYDENVDDFKVSDVGFVGNDVKSGKDCGIKGVRPPLIDTDCSKLDLCSVFGKDCSFVGKDCVFSKKDSVFGNQDSVFGNQDSVFGNKDSVFCKKDGGFGNKGSGLGKDGVGKEGEFVLEESYSFSTSSSLDGDGDGDSSSITTPMSSFSPRRIKRVIVEWQKGELLGRGSFGSVYEGIADDGFFFAVKEVSLLDQEEEGKQRILQLEQEIVLLSQFEHDNIVQYYGTKKDESNLYIFLELVVKGSLMSLYQKYDLRDSQASAYTRQILHGLKYLHDKNVVHRDIKCANILVDPNGSVKVADFGLAKATKFNDVKSCKGTPFWMAPEVVRNRGYGLPADIWSLGCTVLEMLTRSFPYSNLECMAALFRIGNGILPPIPDSLSSEARDFILTCLQDDPNLRPTAAQLLDHPFVKRSLSQSSGSDYLIRRN